MDDATVFVSAWMCHGSILAVAQALAMNCDDVIHAATLLKSMGVNLPDKPVESPANRLLLGWMDEMSFVRRK